MRERQGFCTGWRRIAVKDFQSPLFAAAPLDRASEAMLGSFPPLPLMMFTACTGI